MRTMDDTRKDFYETDESPEKIKAAFDGSAKHWTTPRGAAGQIPQQAGLYEHLSSGLSRLEAHPPAQGSFTD